MCGHCAELHSLLPTGQEQSCPRQVRTASFFIILYLWANLRYKPHRSSHWLTLVRLSLYKEPKIKIMHSGHVNRQNTI
jgi:hypothetical protein